MSAFRMRAEVVAVSELRASPETVWARVASLEGINYELGPWLRIDYILHDRAFDAVSARRVDDASGAGHYPVAADLVFAGAGAPGQPCS